MIVTEQSTINFGTGGGFNYNGLLMHPTSLNFALSTSTATTTYVLVLTSLLATIYGALSVSQSVTAASASITGALSAGTISCGAITTTGAFTLNSSSPSISIVNNSGSGAGAVSTLNLETYIITGSQLPNFSMIATDTGNFGCTVSINQKTPGAIGNTQTTTLALDQNGNATFSASLTVNGYPTFLQTPIMNYTTLPSYTTSNATSVVTATTSTTSNLSTSQLTYQTISTLPIGVWLLNAMITCQGGHEEGGSRGF